MKQKIKILAFETSCDDTSVAIFENEKLIFMDTKSQISIHNITWWVVPEVAAREHANVIFEVIENVLKESKINLEEIDYISVTTNPWLIPSLLTWITVASSFSEILKIPIIPINHIEAHIFANFLERKESDIKFPLVCLTVSGGHNDIYFMKDMWNFEKIWSSTDDAAWELFDKVAKMLNLWYPWGPIISEYAKRFSAKKDKYGLFPRVWLDKEKYDFSFSGLKTNIKREVDKRKLKKYELENSVKKDIIIEKVTKKELKFLENIILDEKDLIEISYETENAITEVLTYKLINAAKNYNTKNILLAWWVSANDKLKNSLEEICEKKWYTFLSPKKKKYSMDNAAMVGILSYYKIKYKKFEEKIWVLEI